MLHSDTQQVQSDRTRCSDSTCLRINLIGQAVFFVFSFQKWEMRIHLFLFRSSHEPDDGQHFFFFFNSEWPGLVAMADK